MVRSEISALTIALVCAFALARPAVSQTACPTPQKMGEGITGYVFEDDKSIAMKAPLEVNTDGSPASYMVGDSGLNYVANGIDLLVGGVALNCKNRSNGCRQKFLDAESKQFGPGTAEFCAFAIEVDQPPGRDATCKNGDGRIIGNGKGTPRTGAAITTVTGTAVVPYISTTRLQHTVGGKPIYLDSDTVPTVVVDRNYEQLLGHVVLLRLPSSGREYFAVAGDTGPAFGEASISVHQLLQYGETHRQAPGHIAAKDRCQKGELDVRAPFKSSPDKDGDVCKAGHVVEKDTDIRAKLGISEPVEMIVLGNAKFVRTGNVISSEVSTASLAQLVAASGYDTARLAKLRSCLR